MKWNFDDLESKLNDASEDLKKCDKDLKQTAENIYYKDETNESVNTLKDILGKILVTLLRIKNTKNGSLLIQKNILKCLNGITVKNSLTVFIVKSLKKVKEHT